MNIELRPACAGDCAVIFDWANNPLTRAMSFSTGEISWPDHQRWFHAQLARPSALFLVAELDRSPVGQVRFACDRADARYPNAIVSVNVAPDLRARGYGTAIVLTGLSLVAERDFTPAVDAYVKPANEASLRMFDRAGFSGRVDVQRVGQPAVRLTWQR